MDRKRLTATELEVLLHYHSSMKDHPQLFSPPYTGVAAGLCDHGLLGRNTSNSGAAYVITERGRIYADAVLSVPLPVQTWAMPPVETWGQP